MRQGSTDLVSRESVAFEGEAGEPCSLRGSGERLESGGAEGTVVEPELVGELRESGVIVVDLVIGIYGVTDAER